MAQTQQSGEVIKQSQPYSRMVFFGTTGQTLTVNISKGGGGAFAAAAGVVTELANGWYKIALTAVDTNSAGDLVYHITAGAGGPLDFQDQVLSQVIGDLTMDASGHVIASGTLRQNQALTAFPFAMTSGGVPKAGLGSTIVAQRNFGSGWQACTNTPTELGNGCYQINLAAADLNSPTISLRFTASGADDNVIFLVMAP